MNNNKFRFFRHAEVTARLKWKRIYIRGRERDRLKDLADLDMPEWKKRRLIRDVIFYSSLSSCLPLLRDLSVYDYESEAERLSDAASYGYCETSSDRVSSATSAEPTTSDADTSERFTTSTSRFSEPGKSLPAETVSEEADGDETVSEEADGDETVSEEADGESSLQPSEPDSPLNAEDELEANEESMESEQNSPERTRRSEDTTILSFSPALSSALNITRKTSDIVEAEECIKDTVQESKCHLIKHPNVSFFKCGNLRKHLRNESPSYASECSISKETTPEEDADRSPPMLLVAPSNLRPVVRRLVQRFAAHFDYPRILECEADEGSFDERVSHVIVDLGLTRHLDFVHYQAIGCKRFLVSAEWLQDCLDAGRIVSADLHELLLCDEETGEGIVAPSRLARLTVSYLFDGFAIVMCKPFVNFKESLVAVLDKDAYFCCPCLTPRNFHATLQFFKNVLSESAIVEQLLSMNGARICAHPRELKDVPGQARLCIVDPQCYQTGKPRARLKMKSMRYKFVVVRYNWLFDSFAMYQVQPLLHYMHDAEIQSALEAGVPYEFLSE